MMIEIKPGKLRLLKATMKSFIDAYEGGVGYTFRNDKLNPKLERKLASIIKQLRPVEVKESEYEPT